MTTKTKINKSAVVRKLLDRYGATLTFSRAQPLLEKRGVFIDGNQFGVLKNRWRHQAEGTTQAPAVKLKRPEKATDEVVDLMAAVRFVRESGGLTAVTAGIDQLEAQIAELTQELEQRHSYVKTFKALVA